jgi:hypothetical protein
LEDHVSRITAVTRAPQRVKSERVARVVGKIEPAGKLERRVVRVGEPLARGNQQALQLARRWRLALEFADPQQIFGSAEVILGPDHE